MRWNDEAKKALGEDLYEALEAIKYLRAQLQLAYFDRNETDVDEVKQTLNEGAAVLRKHGMSDDMMDVDRGD